jgi:hypothetical protein
MATEETVSVKEWEKQLHVMQEPGVAVEDISGM